MFVDSINLTFHIKIEFKALNQTTIIIELIKIQIIISISENAENSPIIPFFKGDELQVIFLFIFFIIL